MRLLDSKRGTRLCLGEAHVRRHCYVCVCFFSGSCVKRVRVHTSTGSGSYFFFCANHFSSVPGWLCLHLNPKRYDTPGQGRSKVDVQPGVAGLHLPGQRRAAVHVRQLRLGPLRVSVACFCLSLPRWGHLPDFGGTRCFRQPP